MNNLLEFLLLLAGFLFLFLACFGWNQPRIALSISQWSRPIEGLNEPADLFYARVYQRLKERLDEAGLPDSRIGFGPGYLFANRTIFGARPQYLIVRYSHLTIYLYCFPLPYGLYVSYWAFSKYTLWLEHPILRWLVFWKSWQMTLYQFDVTDMCLTTINSAVHEVLDDYSAERELKPLEAHERRPILHSFYAKYKQQNVPPAGYVMPLTSVMPLSPSGPIPLPSVPFPAMPVTTTPDGGVPNTNPADNG